MNSRWDQLGIPTPGSVAAQAAGCLCEVMDNHGGHGFAHRGELCFWITDGCPLHARRGIDWELARG